MYSNANRGEGPDPEMFGQVDKRTNMPGNSAVFALLVTSAWFLYFYLSNLAGTWSGPFVFDPTELPIISVYLMYIPIFIQWMRKETEEGVLRRYIFPIMAIAGSAFMVLASIISHRIGCLWYAIVFAVIMVIGAKFERSK
jgi:APA family basic amino acid/polyamine antiporter